MTDIYDPDLYRPGPPHELFAELRETSPVFWQDIPGQPGYWALLRHADVVEVARQPRLYSAETKGVMLEDLDEEALQNMRRMLLSMAPPRHTQYRRPVAPSFRAKVINGLEPQVRQICASILDEAKE